MKKIIFVVEIEKIFDQEMYGKYIKQVGKIVRLYNGKYIARSNKIHSFIGEKPERCIIIGFDSKKNADRCFLSEEYSKIKHLRENSTRSKAFFVENDGDDRFNHKSCLENG